MSHYIYLALKPKISAESTYEKFTQFNEYFISNFCASPHPELKDIWRVNDCSYSELTQALKDPKGYFNHLYYVSIIVFDGQY